VINLKDQKGQSLFEIVMAVTIAGLLIGGVTTGVVVSLRSNSNNISSQIGYSLALETLDKVKSYADSDWAGLYDLSDKTASGEYYLVLDSGTFTILSGEESILGEDIKSGLVGHWKMDETATSTAYDYSGSGNHGSGLGGVSYNASCQIGGCFTFDGSSGRVEIANDSTLAIDGALSISLWFYPTNLSLGRQGLVYKQYNNEYEIIMESSGSISFYHGDGTFEEILEPGSNYITENTWNHLVVTRDTSVGKIYFYVNGDLLGSDDYSDVPLAGSDKIVIGRRDGTSYYFAGSIDDVRIYNRALSEGEVDRIKNSRVYAVHFSMENVDRDSSGAVVTSEGTEDPSTQKVTAYVSWNILGDTKEISVVDYITRTRNNVTVFTDWSGSSGVTGPITAPNNNYDESYGLELNDNPGSITVD